MSIIFKNNKIKNSLNRWFIYLLSFLIPSSFLTIIFAVLNIYPFGKISPLVIDLDRQYIDFLSYFKTIILDNNNFLYSFNQVLGGNMFGFSAYYLFSPLNFVCLFFSREYMTIAAVIIIIFKIGLSGLTFNLFLKNISNDKQKYISLIFSTAYALMAFNTVYYYTIIWLDGIILLPLVVIGINRILNNKKYGVYVLFLFLSFISNYYIGFMIFIFSCLYFMYMVLKSYTFKELLTIKSEEIRCFILSSIFTCLISMFLILPVFLSLLGSKIQVNISMKIFETIIFILLILFSLIIFLIYNKNKYKTKRTKYDVFNSKEDLHKTKKQSNFLDNVSSKLNLSNKSLILIFSTFLIIFFFYSIAPIIGKQFSALSILNENLSLSDVLSKLYTNAFNYAQINNWDYPKTALPQIFSSILVLFLVFVYFFNISFSKREKFLSFSFISIFLISFCIVFIGLIWHGFSKPIWFPARFSFLFSFLLIYIAYRSFCNIRIGINSKSLVYATLTIVIFTLSINSSSYALRTGVNKANLSLDILLILLFASIIYFYFDLYNQNKIFISNKRIITKALFAVFIFSHFLNIYCDSFNAISETSKSYSMINPYSNIEDYKNYIHSNEEVINKIKSNDSNLYRLEKTYYRSSNDSMQFNYNGLTHFSSSERLFPRVFVEKLGFKNHGNRSLYNKGNTSFNDAFLGVKYLLTQDQTTKKPYSFLFEDNNIKVYKNPFALPIGIGIDKNIINYELNSKVIDPFKNQEQLAEYMSGEKKGDLFKYLEPTEIHKENLTETKLSDSVRYTKVDKTKESYVSFKVKIPNDNSIYAYFASSPKNPSQSKKIDAATMYINDESPESYLADDGFNNIIPLNFDEGQTVTFKIKLNENMFVLDRAIFAYEDIEVLSKYYKQLSKETFTPEKISSSHLTGTIQVEDDDRLLLLTVPYEEGWTIKVDGAKVKKLKTCDTLMAVELSKGEHYIEMFYIPDGLICGTIISFITLISGLSYLIFNMTKKRKKNAN